MKNYADKKELWETPMAFMKTLLSKEHEGFEEFMVEIIRRNSDKPNWDESFYNEDERQFVNQLKKPLYVKAMLMHSIFLKVETKAIKTQTKIIKAHDEAVNAFEIYCEGGGIPMAKPWSEKELQEELASIENSVQMVRDEIVKQLQASTDMYEMFGPTSLITTETPQAPGIKTL